jgi:hypothetical protein
MRYYYVPPETLPDGKSPGPLAWEVGSKQMVFQSPHSYSKRIQQRYVIGTIVNQNTGKPALEENGEPQKLYGFRSVWVPDEEKNADWKAEKCGPPVNYLDLRPEERKHLALAKHGPLNAYIKSEYEMADVHDREMALMRERYAKERDELKRLLEEEKAKLVEEAQAMKRKKATERSV